MDMANEVDVSLLHVGRIEGHVDGCSPPSITPSRFIETPESSAGSKEVASVLDAEEEFGSVTHFQWMQRSPMRSVPQKPFAQQVEKEEPKCTSCGLKSAVCLKHLVPESVQLTLSKDGEGGTYFVTSNSREAHLQIVVSDILGVFKPVLEEIGCEGNPRGNDEGCRVDGFHPGTGAKREVAAFALDHYHRANVPETVFKTFPGKGEGSLQRFIPNLYQSWNMSAETRQKIRIADLQYLGLFDIRVLNTDRHGGNILVNPKTGQLFAIDHSYILPPRFVDPEWDWVSWPESKMIIDEHIRKFFLSLDDVKDLETLEELGIDEESRTLFAASSLALKILLTSGRELSLRRIAEFFRRSSMTFPSPFEECVAESRGSLDDGAKINMELLTALLQAKAEEYLRSK